MTLTRVAPRRAAALSCASIPSGRLAADGSFPFQLTDAEGARSFRRTSTWCCASTRPSVPTPPRSSRNTPRHLRLRGLRQALFSS
jgi:hypothetical protein